MNSSFRSGFTIIELIVAMAIMTILISLAAPSFQAFIYKNRTATITNGFLGAINYARSEAITRNRPVVICNRAGSGVACLNGADWSNGWLIYVKNSNSGAIVYDPTKDTLLRQREALPTSYSMMATASVPNIRFFGNGFISMGTLGTCFNVSSTNDKSSTYAKSIVIDRTGRGRVIDWKSEARIC